MTAATPHRQLKERLRQERAALILDVAEEMLIEKGPHDMAIDEIAARAGVAKGTLYQHFASKDELIFALFERNLLLFEDAVARIAAEEIAARDKLLALLHFVYLHERSGRVQLLQLLYGDELIRKLLIEKKRQLPERFERVVAPVRAMLEAGKAAGEFDAAIATELMLANFIYWITLGRYHYLRLGGQLAPAELVAQVARSFFGGITAPREGTTPA